MFSWSNAGNSISTPARANLTVNKELVLMEFGRFIYALFVLTTLSTLGISTSSSHQLKIRCNATHDCTGKDVRNTSDLAGNNFTACCGYFCQFGSPCQLNSSDTNSSFSNTNNFIKDSGENTGNSSNMISNDTTRVNSGQSNTTINESRLYDVCSNVSGCKSDHGKCFSLQCIRKSPRNKIKDCKPCESIDCKDGRCYNLTKAASVTPTAMSKQEITPLQLLLLFGSMGGILVVIIIVYCVKTFTDNRRRQYLLKHGVWENPPKDGKDKDEKVDLDANSEASRQQRKLEVPTITVETEADSSKRKQKNKGNSKDEETDTVGLEESGSIAAEKDSINHKVIPPDQPAKIELEGDPNKPRETESHPKQNANHSLATKKPYSGKTKIGATIESPKKISMPTAWDKENEKTPLSESPKPKRFPNLRKHKEPPNKIIANGTPEKPARFKIQKGSSPVQLCEPENFSDFGM